MGAITNRKPDDAVPANLLAALMGLLHWSSRQAEQFLRSCTAEQIDRVDAAIGDAVRLCACVTAIQSHQDPHGFRALERTKEAHKLFCDVVSKTPEPKAPARTFEGTGPKIYSVATEPTKHVE